VLSLRERRKSCVKCEWAGKLLVWLHEPPPLCPACGAATQDDTPARFGLAPAVAPDNLPGGYLVKHGLCNADGSPRRYDSKTEIRAEAARRGLTISGETPKDPGARWV
jgi:hypothetical protein